MSWPDVASILREFYALLMLLGTLLVVIAVAETFKIGAWVGITLQSNIRRIALFATGCTFILLAFVIYFTGARPFACALEDEKAIRDYYSAIDSKTPQGYQQAWDLLTDSKKQGYFKGNLGYFTGLFRTTDHHEAVLLYPKDRKADLAIYYEALIVIDEYPLNPATQELSKPSKEIIAKHMLDDITAKVTEALNAYYDIDDRLNPVLRQTVATIIASKSITDLIAPDLLEKIPFDERLKSYNFKVREISDPTVTPRNETRRVIVNERHVVKEGNQWHLGHADHLAVAVLP